MQLAAFCKRAVSRRSSDGISKVATACVFARSKVLHVLHVAKPQGGKGSDRGSGGLVAGSSALAEVSVRKVGSSTCLVDVPG